jgi:two-component sensor histidine kinase
LIQLISLVYHRAKHALMGDAVSSEWVGVDKILNTPGLYKRPPRDCLLDNELAAHRELSALMAVDAELAIQRFLELALQLCPAAGSAGLSEVAVDDAGEPIFKWTAMSGAFAPYVGGITPRHFSPCGLCLDHHHAILVERPARVFTYFNDAEPEIVEGLIVPLYDTGKRPLGTLWMTSHNQAGRFDPTDVRILEQLAVQLVLAIKLRRKAKILVEMEQLVRDRDLLIQEVNHRVKNTIQMTSALLHLQERGASKEARQALKEAQGRLLVLATVYEALLHPGEGGDLTTIDMCALLDRLAGALGASLQPSKRIKLTTACDGVLLDSSQAVPVGLIVNEAVTNALKHAFPHRSSGEVVVELSTAGRLCSLAIKDDGVGFEHPLREGSLGLRLIRSLAQQLGTTVEVDGTSGTIVKLEWRLPRSSQRGARDSRVSDVGASTGAIAHHYLQWPVP